jgi:hypothetical protein
MKVSVIPEEQNITQEHGFLADGYNSIHLQAEMHRMKALTLYNELGFAD